MSLRSFPVFAGATLLIALTPGPNVFFILSQGFRAGFGAVLRAIPGIELAPLVYVVISSLGLSYLLAAWPDAIGTIRLLGALYLTYLGLRMCRTSLAPAVAAAPGLAGERSLFLQGFLTSFSNPKTILYFSAFLPQFIEVVKPVAPQLAMLGLWAVATETVVLLGYGSVAALTRHAIAGPAFIRRVDFIAGAFLAGLGLYLVWLELAPR